MCIKNKLFCFLVMFAITTPIIADDEVKFTATSGDSPKKTDAGPRDAHDTECRRATNDRFFVENTISWDWTANNNYNYDGRSCNPHVAERKEIEVTTPAGSIKVEVPSRVCAKVKCNIDGGIGHRHGQTCKATCEVKVMSREWN